MNTETQAVHDVADPAPARPTCLFPRLDRFITLITEPPAAALVAILLGLLFAGVIARYGFGRPFVWGDELSSTLFLWLVMFGAVIALRRDEHLSLGFFLRNVRPEVRRLLQALTAFVIACYLLFLLLPAIHYVQDERIITLTTLGISAGWRVGALLVGVVLMLVVSIYQLLELLTVKLAVSCLAIVVAAALCLWLIIPFTTSIGNYNLFIYFGVLVGIGMVVGLPIAFCFGVATVVYLASMTRMPMTIVINRMDEGMSNILLLAIPAFVFLGCILDISGMGRAIINFLASVLGHVRAGMSYVLLGSLYLVSGISGSKVSDMATVAPALFPEMKRRGQSPKEMVSILATGAVMAETVPPSIMMVAVGSVTGVSIAGLFSGGFVVAGILVLFLAALARLRSKGENMEGVRRAPVSRMGKLLLIGLPAIILPFLIRAAVVEGVATATEVSTFAIFYAIVVSAIFYGGVDFRKFYPLLVDTASLSGAILLILGTAQGMAWALTQTGFASGLAGLMTSLPGGWYTFMLLSILIFIVFGCVLEGLPAIVLLGPFLFPIARTLGINDVQYGLVAIVAMNIGLMAPPVGIGYYLACSIGRVSPDEALLTIWPYLFALFCGLLLVAAVPGISVGFF